MAGAAGGARAAADLRRAPSVDEVLALTARDKKRAGGTRAVRAGGGARRRDARATGWRPAACEAAVEEVHAG